ncbi:methyltransferase domain-containing protein, partial [Candidatus Saccharibacteria bacterium]|nr:methyltransferase domain-containing protein [Candidatus Saccharibacteria bacterium]NIW80458.1 methyltransferase domain-containing protein [Calditrichia bacterium]
MNNVQIFDELAAEYDQWFDEHPLAYQSELQALRRYIPAKGKGIEIGVGSGKFAKPLGIAVGIEPAEGMAELAKQRGIKVFKATAEDLPFRDETHDFVLFVTTLCFVDNPWRSLREAHRILKPSGSIIIGMIDRDSPRGQAYFSMKKESPFYQYAQSYSAREVLQLVRC